MVDIWYAILVLMLGIYLVLDGWNIGVGVVHYAVACDQQQRRLSLRALGHSWSWHEVWLIAFGGTLFMAFPAVYASSFAGFYFAFFLLLWALILRGLAIEVRDFIDDALWRSWWDGVFCLSSTLLAFLIGVSAANLLRGVPLNEHGDFSLPLFTTGATQGQVGLLDWYTLAVGGFTVLALAAHGAGYLAHTAQGPYRERAVRVARRAWVAALLVLPLVSLLTVRVRPGYFLGMLSHPCAWPGVALVLAGAGLVIAGVWRSQMRMLFAGGSAILLGLVTATGAGLYPVMLFSTTLAPSLTAVNSSIPVPTLAISLIWWLVSALFLAGYTWFVLSPPSATQDPGP